MTTTYAEHVSHDMLTYPAPETPGADAWEQLGPEMTDHYGVTYVGVRGMDGCEYVAESVSPGAWRIVRAGHYGLGAVTSGHTLKSAVQHLNAFHAGETCDHCGHVNSWRGHGCEACGRIRYALRYAPEVTPLRTPDGRACSCARNTDGSVTTFLCPIHADTDPCLTMARDTGRRRKGTIRRGVCTSCGHTTRA